MVNQIELLTPTIRHQFGTSVSKSNRMRKRMGEIGSSGSNCNNVMCSPQMGVPQPPPPPMPSRKRICRARKHYPPKQQHKEDPWWMRIQIGDNSEDNNNDNNNDKDNDSCIFDDRRNERSASMNSIGLYDALDGELLESKPRSLECEVDITKTSCDLYSSTSTIRTADTTIMQPWDFL